MRKYVVSLLMSLVLITLVSGLAFATQTKTAVEKGVISTEELAQIYNNPDVRILDCRPLSAYKFSHIPNAVHIFVRTDLAYYKNGIEDMIKPVKELEAFFSKLGIDDNTLVVVYGGFKDRAPCRAFLILDYLGHKKILKLDGDFPKWAREKRPITKVVPNITPAHFVAHIQPGVIVDKEYVYDHLNDSNTILVDGRSLAEYEGKIPGTNVKRGGGHIPGAIFFPWDNVYAPDGTYLPAKKIKEMLVAKGITPNKNIIFYCRTCVRSGTTYMITKYISKYPNVHLYDGSMVEWSADPNMPLEK